MPPLDPDACRTTSDEGRDAAEAPNQHKRAAPEEQGAGTRSSKRSRRSVPYGLFVYHVFRALQRRYQIDMPIPMFVGTCAYLSTLLSWDWPLLPHSYGQFVVRYKDFLVDPTSRPTHGKPGPISYHTWFMAQPTAAQEAKDPVLTTVALEQLQRENPYSFALVEKKMESLMHESVNCS
ncbi:hypothetical protein H2202_010995 [Exophiala xenobiotica]|nr:hypothetical protein H2202_010995 [Exophiala xenobiotica]KAK5332328.1 hypothetical protein LTR98_011540 [Exophiala xenobiotica]